MAAVKINPMKLPGPWVEGYVLEFHSVKSTPTGDPYHPFDTERTELGDRVYRLKYGREGSVVTDIVDTAEQFIKKWNPPVDCLVPAPPSLTRKSQPVVEIVGELSKRLGLPACEDAVIKAKPTPQMKNIKDWSERQKVLQEAVQAGKGDVKCKSVLLFDDLIESGSTLRRAADVLLDEGAARSVYTLVLTRTR